MIFLIDRRGKLGEVYIDRVEVWNFKSRKKFQRLLVYRKIGLGVIKLN